MGWRWNRSAWTACAALLGACALLSGAAPAGAGGLRRDTSTAPPTGGTSGYTATLEQCVTASAQSERSVTIAVQMDATATARSMAVEIELEQRLKGETAYHTLAAPGLGVWERSEAGVQIYKYVKQVTNLTAPASYRALVRFRWVGDKDHTLKRAELRTDRCWQPVAPKQVVQPQSPTPAAPTTPTT